MTNCENAIKELKSWAQELAREFSDVQIYLFGSLVYRGGTQFNDMSDVDLVLVMPDTLSEASSRTDWLKRLRVLKQELELRLFQILSRDASNSICSVVAITRRELAADLHKDCASKFFSRNKFLYLLTEVESNGIERAGEQPINERLVEQPLRYIQKLRNTFLNVSANGTAVMGPYDDTDPAPKQIMRQAAMVAALYYNETEYGTEYDTQKGLDFLSAHLYDKRKQDKRFGDVQNQLSIRRGARGTRSAISPEDHLFLSEVIYDLATNFWKIIVSPSGNTTPTNRTDTMRKLVNLADEYDSIRKNDASARRTNLMSSVANEMRIACLDLDDLNYVEFIADPSEGKRLAGFVFLQSKPDPRSIGSWIKSVYRDKIGRCSMSVGLDAVFDVLAAAAGNKEKIPNEVRAQLLGQSSRKIIQEDSNLKRRHERVLSLLGDSTQ